MKKLFIILLFTSFISSCNHKKNKDETLEHKTALNKDLVEELEEIREIDQVAADIARGADQNLSEENWKLKQDSLHRNNQKRIKQIFNQYGFVGYDLAGERGSQNFWLVVQHADNDPEFQKKVLDKMRLELEEDNADSKSYGLLVDRVRLNNGEKQLYGTQVDYNWKICQAYPRKLEDSANVNKRRTKIGLQPLENYLNEMSQLHYEINENAFQQIGIDGPALYKTE